MLWKNRNVFTGFSASVSPHMMVARSKRIQSTLSLRVAQLHSRVHTDLSIHYLSSCPTLDPGPGPTNCHRVAPAHSKLSIPPVCHQPQAPLHGVPAARPAAPSSDVPPASCSPHISSVSHHTSQCQCCQPQWGVYRGACQWPGHT